MNINLIKNSHYRMIFWGIVILAVILGMVFILFRAVDADEGFYLSASAMVADGNRPYLDFFFPQMPFLTLALAPGA